MWGVTETKYRKLHNAVKNSQLSIVAVNGCTVLKIVVIDSGLVMVRGVEDIIHVSTSNRGYFSVMDK